MEMFIPAVEKPQQAARAGCMEQTSYPSAWERLKTWESPPVASLQESSSRGQETNAVTVTGQSDIVDTKLELYRTHRGPQFEMVLKMKSILFFARACVVHVCVCLDTYMCRSTYVHYVHRHTDDIRCVSQWLFLVLEELFNVGVC